jgi:serine phosphatase RsbU (regulator of sigma subunit)
MWDLSYRTKLMGVVCALVLLSGAVVSWLAYRGARSAARTLADSLFREVSAHAVTHTRAFVLRAAPLAESLARLGDRGLALDSPDRLARQLLPFLEGNPGLSWVSCSDEDGTFTGVYRTHEGGLRVNQSRLEGGRTRLVEHDVAPDGSWRLARRSDDSGYDPRIRPFYRAAKKQGRLVWLAPYVFYDQGVPGVSCATPVRDASGRFRGVLSIDFDLNALSDFVRGLRLSENATLFLFTADGVLLAHPNRRVVGAGGKRDAGHLLTLADTGDPLVEDYRAHLPPGPLPPGEGERFVLFDVHHAGADYLASATTFRVGDDLVWVVGAAAPKSDFLEGVWRTLAVSLAISAAALLAGAALAAAMARLVSGPVLSLIDAMRQVGAGDLEVRADLGGSKELRELSAALNHMIADLRDRLRLRHSLDVAMEVQQRLLPRRPPAVPGLDVAGHSTYCDETGGDYYDFLVLEEQPGGLLVALGDVMGHGVAAALVMAGARAVLRDRAATAGSLAALLVRLNRLLAADLEGTRFMTMHLSFVDPRASTFRWVSAGHDPAILYDPAADRFVEMDAGSLPLGIEEGAAYEESAYSPLRPGQVLFVGTDGVWESPNAANEQFGKGRVREAIRAASSGTAAAIAEAVRARLCEFRGECRQVDDVTFVVIKVTGTGERGVSTP